MSGSGTTLEDDRKRAAQPLRKEFGPMHAAGVRRDDHDPVVAEAFLLQIVAQRGHCHQIVDRAIEEALNLRRVEVHRHHPFDAHDFQKIGDDLSGDRLAAFGLLILLRVSIVRHNRRDPSGAGAFERIDHQQQLHDRIVDGIAVGRFTGRLNDEDF